MSGQTAIWLDGAPASSLPLPDRGLDFGDGLFETLLLRSGEALFVDAHLARLKRGLQALSFPDCLDDIENQLQLVLIAVSARDWHWSALRLTVTRGTGPRGYAPPLQAKPRIIIVVSELDLDCSTMAAPANLSLASTRWPSQPMLAGLKHLNRLEQVLAARECQLAGADEVLMLNQSGAAVSVAAGNLFALHGERLLTPSLDDCGIAGTRRQLLLQRWAPAIGLDVEVVTLTVRQVETADEVFYSNTLVGLRAVASFGERSWHSHDVCEALFRQYEGDIP